MRFLLFTPLIEGALLKMLLKVERSWLQFMNLNVLRTKRNEFLRLSLFNHVLAGLCYRLVAEPKAKCVKRTWSIIYNFGLKIQPVDRIFLRGERTFPCVLCTRKIGNLSTRRCVLGTTDANRKYFCSMTATAHVKTFLSCGHGLQNASSQVETRGSNSGFFEEYSSYKSRNSSSEIMFSS